VGRRRPVRVDVIHCRVTFAGGTSRSDRKISFTRDVYFRPITHNGAAMDGFSILHTAEWQPQDVTALPEYAAGNALGWLHRGNKQAATNHLLSGRLYLSKNGWLFLSVPNALVRGVYDALTAPGAELPTSGVWNIEGDKADLLNAHISVMTADEVNKIGPDKINERGHMFGYSMGALKEIEQPANHLSRVWAIQVSSPALSALRKSYGLSALPNGDHAFHITVAVRRKNVLRNNDVSRFDVASGRGELKAAEFSRSGTKLSRAGQKDLLPGGKADNVPDREISPEALAEGQKDEHEHTRNDQVAKEIAKDHLLQDPQHYEKETLMEKVTAPQMPAIVRLVTGKQANSVYVNQALNALNTRQPIRYDHTKPVFENILNQAQEMKRRGDFIRQTKRNHETYLSALSPRHRHQRMLQAFHGTIPQENQFDDAVERYGDGVLAQLGGMYGKPSR
jgi:hypothetical protein